MGRLQSTGPCTYRTMFAINMLSDWACAWTKSTDEAFCVLLSAFRAIGRYDIMGLCRRLLVSRSQPVQTASSGQCEPVSSRDYEESSCSEEESFETERKLYSLILLVADDLKNVKQCIQLARKLNVERSIMGRLQSFRRKPYRMMFAINMLSEWDCAWTKCADEAYRVLLSALGEIGKQDIMRRSRQHPVSVVEREGYEGGTSDFSPQAQPVSAKAVAQVARDMPSLKACVSLATKLNFSELEVLHLEAMEFKKMKTAREILNEWVCREDKHATEQALYDALIASDLKCIAKRLKT